MNESHKAQLFKGFSNKVNCVIAIAKTQKVGRMNCLRGNDCSITKHCFPFIKARLQRLQMNSRIAQWDSLYILNVPKNMYFFSKIVSHSLVFLPISLSEWVKFREVLADSPFLYFTRVRDSHGLCRLSSQPGLSSDKQSRSRTSCKAGLQNRKAGQYQAGQQEPRKRKGSNLDGLTMAIDCSKGRSLDTSMSWRGGLEWTAEIVCLISLMGQEHSKFRPGVKSWAYFMVVGFPITPSSSRNDQLYGCPVRSTDPQHTPPAVPQSLSSTYTYNFSFNHSGPSSWKYLLLSQTHRAHDGSSI